MEGSKALTLLYVQYQPSRVVNPLEIIAQFWTVLLIPIKIWIRTTSIFATIFFNAIVTKVNQKYSVRKQTARNIPTVIGTRKFLVTINACMWGATMKWTFWPTDQPMQGMFSHFFLLLTDIMAEEFPHPNWQTDRTLQAALYAMYCSRQ